LIGTPVTAFTASAAPPRASPSSLVSTTPSSSSALREGLGHVHGVAAHQRVADQQRVRGLRGALDLLELLHQRLVDREAAGGVVDDRVEALARGTLRGRVRRSPAASRPGSHRVHRHADQPLAERWSWSTAAGR
jgi:hypothetical protein